MKKHKWKYKSTKLQHTNNFIRLQVIKLFLQLNCHTYIHTQKRLMQAGNRGDLHNFSGQSASVTQGCVAAMFNINKINVTKRWWKFSII